MNQNNKEMLNEFLVDIFHDILKIQEDSLKHGQFSDLSLNKMHILEQICMRDPKTNTMSAIAESLEITVGSLTVAVESLVKKGYLRRIRSNVDKRVVSVEPTQKAILADEEHKQFHKQMVEQVTAVLTPEELQVFTKGIQTLASHFNKLKNNR